MKLSATEKDYIRFHFALYLSLLLHGLVLIWAFFTVQHFPIFCGIEYPEELERELSFQIDFNTPIEFEIGEEEGSHQESESKLDELGSMDMSMKQEQNGSENEKGNSNSLKEKYKGTEWEKLVEQLDSVKDLRKNYLEDYDNLLLNRDVANSYIKRFRHYEDMIVKEVFPSIHSIEKPFEEEIKEAEKVLEHHLTRNEIIEEFRSPVDPEYKNKVELEKEKQKDKSKPLPLKMNQEERDKYLDKILTNTKESQIQEFVDNFSEYDPNEGDLPFMYRDLYYKNLQRLAYTFSSDPTYFTIDYFEENLNKEDYLRHAMNLVSKMKGTKTATEILFTILDIYEIQERAIQQYFQNKEMWKTYTAEQKKQIRYETIRRVLEKYDPIFQSKNIKTYEDVTKLYGKKKQQIVDFLLKTTPNGYRVADAHFEKGRLHWEKYMKTQDQQELERALSEWITSFSLSNSSEGEFLNKETLQQILPYIKTSQTAENNKNAIQMYIFSRLNKHLESKRIREEKLLWKK